MTAEEILKSENLFFKNELVGGIPCAIGYDKKFRWGWLATQLNTFVFIGESNTHIDKGAIEAFSASCYKYALKNNKGWPRGLQSGVTSIAILKGDKVEGSAVKFCESPSKKHWSAFEIPVVFHTAGKKAIRFTSKPIWGRIYMSYLANLIDELTSKF